MKGGPRGTRLVVGSRSFRLCFRSVLGKVFVDVGCAGTGLRAGESRLYQNSCNRQGFNTESDSCYQQGLGLSDCRLRLGIWFNQEDDCGSSDSFVVEAIGYARQLTAAIILAARYEENLRQGALQRRRRGHARRSPRGREDARGNGTNRAARVR